jgi:hypothetical protein
LCVDKCDCCKIEKCIKKDKWTCCLVDPKGKMLKIAEKKNLNQMLIVNKFSLPTSNVNNQQISAITKKELVTGNMEIRCTKNI